MTELERQFNRRLGVLKGLQTRWEKQGYEFDIDYNRPKRITEGSIRRVNAEIEEVRRQHDVQSGPTFSELRRERDSLIDVANALVSGSRRGTVGRDRYLGKQDGPANSLTINNAEWVKDRLRDYYNEARESFDKAKKLLENIKATKDDLEDYIEQIVLAVYKEETAVWGGGIAGFDDIKSAFAAAFRYALEEGM